MFTKTVNATAKTAYGTKLKTPIRYSYKWSGYETPAEQQEAKDELSSEEQRKVRNEERKLKERNAALTQALKDAGYEKPDNKNSDVMKLKNMVDVFLSVKGTTEEVARQKAEAALGMTFAQAEANDAQSFGQATDDDETTEESK